MISWCTIWGVCFVRKHFNDCYRARKSVKEYIEQYLVRSSNSISGGRGAVRSPATTEQYLTRLLPLPCCITTLRHLKFGSNLLHDVYAGEVMAKCHVLLHLPRLVLSLHAKWMIAEDSTNVHHVNATRNSTGSVSESPKPCRPVAAWWRSASCSTPARTRKPRSLRAKKELSSLLKQMSGMWLMSMTK